MRGVTELPMQLDRRTVLAGIATLWPAIGRAQEVSRPVAYRVWGNPVRFSWHPPDFIEAEQIIRASDWRYQTIDPAADDMRGIIRHLPSGFAFLTVQDELAPWPSPNFMQKAYFLLAEGETGPGDVVFRTAIARAASHIGANAEILGGGTYYMQRNCTDPDVEELEAPPFIVAQTAEGFLLNEA